MWLIFNSVNDASSRRHQPLQYIQNLVLLSSSESMVHQLRLAEPGPALTLSDKMNTDCTRTTRFH